MEECIFCRIIKHQQEACIVYEDDTVIAFLDSDPINTGHVLLVPKDHYLDVDELPEELLIHISKVSQKIVKAIKATFHPDGYSAIQCGGMFNDIGHYHLHLFPRYKEDGFGWKDTILESYTSDKIARQIMEQIE
ncbi:MAG: HIT family protein [bacterium]|nr:HIT family protein [bacterium]